MTSMCHGYVSGTPTTSLTPWLKDVAFHQDQFSTSFSSYVVVVLFSLGNLELDMYV